MKTPKCRAKNPMLCNDAKCPERRFNLKYSKQLFKDAQKHIESLKETNSYAGEEKESADLAYHSALDWHNELLADSKMSGADALEWIEEVNKKYDAIIKVQKEIEERMNNVGSDNEAYYVIAKELNDFQQKTDEARSEFSEAYRAFYATYEGQRDLWEKYRTIKRYSPNKKSELKKLQSNISEGDNLHSQQIIAAAIVDRKMKANSDLPIEVKNVTDLKVLSKTELQEYTNWLRGGDSMQSFNEQIMQGKYTSIFKVFTVEGETEHYLHNVHTGEKHQIPEVVSKTLYNMPDTTNRVENIFNKHKYLNRKPADKTSSEYYAWAAAKYDATAAKKYVK